MKLWNVMVYKLMTKSRQIFLLPRNYYIYTQSVLRIGKELSAEHKERTKVRDEI
ncbi:hypothetical protein Bandiella_00106 [Candidatus Bandiella woodruffii]|uniref:Uncharacterized protein n=1 Tax=Candidatus Bandiella euplotis TaxID=1664265 RepID=A0ABZ0UJY3_9RICK|nr:hypothetical protein Bandiella_00106 [Candidatus Bandiella woodruffii]